MFLSIVKFFRGYVHVRLSGYAPERFLNLCSNHNILIWKLTKLGDEYDFYISVAGFRQLKPFLKKTNTRISILEKVGIPFYMRRYRKRKVYFVGIFVFFGFLFLLSRYIWNIQIDGNTYVTDETILLYLEDQGHGFGTLKSNINCEELEASIRSEFPNVIWTSARVAGTKLTIDIKENIINKETSSTLEDGIPSDLVSDKDAVIDSIVTRKGTPQVAAGDTVEKGDVLVSGRVDILNDNGEISNYQYYVSDADIYGLTEYEYSDTFPLNYEKKMVTGNTQKIYAIGFGDKNIKIGWKKIKYEQYNMISDYLQMHICSDFYLPITLVSNTYEEYQLEPCVYTEKQAKALSNKKLSIYLDKLKEKDIQIIEKNVIIDIEKNYCRSSGSIKAREKIGTASATEIITLPVDERQISDELE